MRQCDLAFEWETQVIKPPQTNDSKPAMYVNKWTSFATSCLVQASAGTGYCFSIFGPTFKEAFGFQETEVAAMGSLFNIGGLFSIGAGLLYASLSDKHRLGPRLVMWLGCLCLACGYTGLYLCVTGYIKPNLITVLVFAFIAGNSGTWFDTSALTTNLRNFSGQRGVVVGILKAFFGMSASVYTSIYLALFEPDTVSFLRFMGYAPGIFIFLCTFAINYIPDTSSASARTTCFGSQARFFVIYGILTVMAVFQLCSSIYSQEYVVSPEKRQLFVVTIFGILATLLMVPISTGDCLISKARIDQSSTSQNAQHPKSGEAGDSEAIPSTQPLLPNQNEEISSNADHDSALTMSSPAFWLLLAEFTVGISTGLVLINNLGSMLISLGGHSGGQVVFVSLFSVCNASGRLVSGYMSEHFLAVKAIPRPAFLIATAVLNFVLVVLLTRLDLRMMYPVSILGGFLFGSYWSLVPSVVSDLFPMSEFSTVYTSLQAGPAVGGYLMATVVTGWVYEHEAAAQGGGAYCMGVQCYSKTFLVLLFFNAIGILCSIGLYGYSRHMYCKEADLDSGQHEG